MKHFTFALLALLTPLALSAAEYSVTSPRGNNKVVVTIGGDIRYSVIHNSVELIEPSPISITM